MRDSTTLRRHADLVDRMATALGLDLEQKVMEGKVLSETIGDAVLRCAGCTGPENCEHWLAVQHGTADAPPGMCRNTDLFDLLKAGKRA